jgi:Xaa-Pro aminopeptidase
LKTESGKTMSDERIEGMADAHEAVMAAYRKALDAIEFMVEVEGEINGWPKEKDVREKLSFAGGVLAVMMELFDDEYYRIIEKAKNDVDNE